MKEHVKRILGLLLSFSMLCSVLPMTAMAGSEYKDFNADGYLWLEETDYADRNSYSNLITGVDIFSGGGARALGLQQAPDANGYYMEYNVNVPSTGNYRIWTHGQYSGNEWCSPAKVVIDGTTSIDFIAEKVTTWNAKSICGLDYAIAYQYADVNLTAGNHTIRYVIDTVAPRNTAWYLGVLDFMLIMPASYTWDISTTARPVNPNPEPTPTPTPEVEYKEFNSDGYLWLEETDYSDRNAYSNHIKDVDIFSGGGARALGLQQAPDANGYYMEYNVNVPSTGNYKIWTHGQYSGNEWCSPAKVVIDGTTSIDFIAEKVTTWNAKSICGLDYAIAYQYADVDLTAGKHTIRYVIDTVAPRNTSWYLGVLDFMLIMPVSYTWDISTTARPVAPTPTPTPTPTPEIEYKEFHEDGYLWLEETDYYDRNAYSNVVSGDIFSGGQVRALGLSVAPDANGYYMEYRVNVPKTDDYKIWVHGGMSGGDWSSPSKVVIDGTASVDFIAEKVTTWSASSYGLGYAIAHQYVDVNLTEGKHTIRYVIDDVAPKNTSYYIGALDFMLIVPKSYTWTPSITEKPVKPQKINISSDTMVWIDASDAIDGNKVTAVSSNLLHETEGVTIATSTAPTDSNQYYIEFGLQNESEEVYDIYLRGSSDRDAWNSEPTVNVNGTDYEITDMGYDEGWVNSNYNLAWSKVEGVNIPSGDSSLKWIVKTSRVASTEYYIAIFDAFVIMPHGAPFKPVSKDLDLTKLDGELAVSLAGENILCPRKNVNLPEETINGKSVTWSTDDASLFSVSGQITRNWYDNPVTVTAVVGNDEYTRAFDVVIPGLVPFILDGDVTVGATSINATVYFDEDAQDVDATVIVALYDSEKELQNIQIIPKSFSQEENYFDINMTLTRPVEDGDTFTVFVWDDLESLNPLTPRLTLGSKLLLKPFNGDVCFHVDEMEAYLNDSYDSIAEYADGSERLDNPLPITFRWSWIGKDRAPEEYTLSVSESPDMNNAKEYTVNATSYDVYNLKVDTEYYWTVSATDERGNLVVSDIATMKTEDKAPRNIYINGGFNARDIGGWNTLDGGQVKQGYLYRTGRLNYISSTDGTTLKEQINSDDIDTLVNDLGIKTEIDIRLESEMPLEYTQSVLGEDINYVRAPMNYNGDYLSENKESIKTVFETFADPENYPMVYHCAAGADRTGAITYLLNGLLGVSQEDLFRDYLITNFAAQGFRPVSNISNLYVKTIDEYHGDTLSEKIYNYLNEVIGVATEDLDFIIEYLK